MNGENQIRREFLSYSMYWCAMGKSIAASFIFPVIYSCSASLGLLSQGSKILINTKGPNTFCSCLLKINIALIVFQTKTLPKSRSWCTSFSFSFTLIYYFQSSSTTDWQSSVENAVQKYFVHCLPMTFACELWTVRCFLWHAPTSVYVDWYEWKHASSIPIFYTNMFHFPLILLANCTFPYIHFFCPRATVRYLPEKGSKAVCLWIGCGILTS